MLTNNYDNIPQELRELPQWVCCGDAKVPMRAFEDKPASSVNPETWSAFDRALKSVNANRYSYCGFVFADNGYVGIDIDAGLDDYGLMSPLAADIIGKCKSYTEISRSGRGYHIIVKGDLPFKGKNNLSGVEIYKTARYFIMTGNTLLYRDIRPNQGAIDYVVDTYFSQTLRDNEFGIETAKIYSPVWEKPVFDGKRIKVRPTYPDIKEGCRNISLTSLAGMLHNIGYSKSQIRNELKFVNKKACTPPLGMNEIDSICDSIARYRR